MGVFVRWRGALITAAREDADAYVGQTPVYDGIRTVRYVVGQQGPEYGLRMSAAAFKDLARKYARREPYYIPIIGDAEEGEVVALPSPGSKEGHEAMLPEEWGPEERAEWNQCAARVILQTGRYRPIKYAADVDCPAFVVEADRGPTRTEKCHRRDGVEAPRRELGRIRHRPLRGLLRRPVREEVVEREGAFLEYHLLEAARR